MTDLRRHVPPLTLVWDDEAPGALHRTVDGTLVFADVSGFTALTERLSRQGRIGAEEIVEALNRVFGPMLTIAAARGGELLKFGGDALLFLFRGEDHPEQACDAAVEMRASLRAAAAVPTSAGRLLAVDVGGRARRRHRALPRRLPHPRAARARPRRERGGPRREGRRGRPGRRQPGDRGPAPPRPHPPARRRRAAAAPPPAAHRARPPGIRAAATRSSGWRPCSRPPSASSWHPGRPTPSTGSPRSPSSGSPAPTPFSHRQGPQALAERLHEVVSTGRGGARGRGRHPAGHRPRHRRRQVLPRLRGAEHPRGRRGPDAAGAAAGRGCRPPPPAAARA